MNKTCEDEMLSQMVEAEKERQAKTWGDVYNVLLKRGYDHGYAAYRADEWDKNRVRKGSLRGDGK